MGIIADFFSWSESTRSRFALLQCWEERGSDQVRLCAARTGSAFQSLPDAMEDSIAGNSSSQVWLVRRARLGKNLSNLSFNRSWERTWRCSHMDKGHLHLFVLGFQMLLIGKEVRHTLPCILAENRLFLWHLPRRIAYTDAICFYIFQRTKLPSAIPSKPTAQSHKADSTST